LPSPEFVRAHKFGAVLIPCRELEVEVGKTEVTEQAQHEVQKTSQLRLEVIGGYENVGIIHGETAHARQTVNHPAFFIPIDGAELE
jgi:hypothetical protein